MKIIKRFPMFFLAGALLISGCSSASQDKSAQTSSSTQESSSETSSGETTDYRVTSEEFNEALSLRWKNLTMIGEIQQDRKVNLVLELLEDGSLHESYQSDFKPWPEAWNRYDAESNKWFAYSPYNDEGVWANNNAIVYESAEDYENGNYGDGIGLFAIIVGMVRYNETFQYNETEHKYSGIVNIMEMDFNATVSFENKKAVSLQLSVENDGHSMAFNAQFVKYNQTEISWPNWMGEEDWKDGVIDNVNQQ